MNPHRFDTLTRRLATAGAARLDRRTLLRALGLGGAVSALPGHAAREVVAQHAASDAPNEPTVEQLAADLLYDVDAIFRFVRDEVQYDRYSGALRGARGTLWGLAGNSVDQTLLLAALLNEALVPTRFAVGDLTVDAADRLLVSGLPDAETIRDRAVHLFLPPPPSADQSIPLTPEDEEWARGLPEFAAFFRDTIDRHLAGGTATILDALAGAGIALPEPAPALPDLEQRQHVWLQYADGAYWIDLDPSIPDAEPGAVHTTDVATLDRLPEDLVHRVAFRLVAEKVVGGEPTRQELLAYEAPSSDLVGVPLSLFHPPADALKAAGVAIQGALGGYVNFMPHLLVGAETVSGKPVTFGTGGGALDALGGGGAIEGDTLAEWLEIDVRTPDGERHLVREVFDRVGADRRASGPIDPATVPPIEFASAVDPEFSYFPLAGFWSIAVVTGPVPARYFERDPAVDVGVADLADLPVAYHFARDIFALRDTVAPGYRTYLDAPNLTACVLRPTAVATDGQTVVGGMDLIHRSVAAMQTGVATAGIHPLVAAGVLSHAIELATIESAGQAPLNLPVQVTAGVIRVFEEATRQGVRTLVLRPDDAGAPLPAVAEGARQRIRLALTDGYVVIVPERAVTLGGAERTGWWLIDPTTGATLDQMDDGGGATAAEYILAARIVTCGGFLVALGLGVYFGAMSAYLQLTAGEMEGAGNDLLAAEARAAAARNRNRGERAAKGAGVAAGACGVALAGPGLAL